MGFFEIFSTVLAARHAERATEQWVDNTFEIAAMKEQARQEGRRLNSYFDEQVILQAFGGRVPEARNIPRDGLFVPIDPLELAQLLAYIELEPRASAIILYHDTYDKGPEDRIFAAYIRKNLAYIREAQNYGPDVRFFSYHVRKYGARTKDWSRDPDVGGVARQLCREAYKRLRCRVGTYEVGCAGFRGGKTKGYVRHSCLEHHFLTQLGCTPNTEIV